MENIEIRLLEPTDKENLINFLNERYLIDGPPLNFLLKPPQQDIDFDIRQMIDEALRYPDKICSHLAIDKTNGNIIGCALRKYEYTNHQQIDSDSNLHYFKGNLSEKAQSIADFSRMMWSGVEEFLPSDYSGPYLICDLGFVRSEYRRMGLMKKMRRIGMERAWKELGCRYAIALCTSHKSQQHCVEDGWTTLRWINYKDYYVQGKRVFNFPPDSKEKCAKLMMDDLKDLKDWLEGPGARAKL